MNHFRARSYALFVAIFLPALFLLPSLAKADFGFLPGSEGFEAALSEENGSPATNGGSHPYALNVKVGFEPEGAGPFSDGDVKDLALALPPGLLENPTVVDRCTIAQFSIPRISPFQESRSGESCPDKSQVGTITVHTVLGGGATRTFGLFNLTPPPGAPSQLGASPFGMPLVFVPEVRSADGEYGLSLRTRNVSQQLGLAGFELTLWGNPWLVGHDSERGNCLNEEDPEAYFGEDAVLDREPQTQPPTPPFYEPGTCSIGNPKTFLPTAYLTLPSSCEGPLAFAAAASSWQQPGVATTSFSTPAQTGCEKLALATEGSALPSTNRTTSAAGLDFLLEVNQNGLLVNYTPTGRLVPSVRAPTQAKRALVTLPEGMTINPSVGAGLGGCNPAQYAAETLTSAPGAGCPNVSKIGELTVESPLFDEQIRGSLFLAQPDDKLTTPPGAENPFDSLIALYMVAKTPERGIIVKVAGKVSADPRSGRLVTDFDNLPQLPYFRFRVRFRDGQRSPLATPSACGLYGSQVDLTPWRDLGAVRHDGAFFQLAAGIGGGPCPSANAPFAPKSVGGTRNRNAGSHSPFYLHLTRTDAEQEITSYSTTLPRGLLGDISEIPYCPEAAIARAKANSGFAEARNPSCSAASSIGRTVSGYGLGSVLAYAPGGLYLAGPYHGSSFSIVAIDSATVGPFDLGVIIVRSAIRVDRRTAQVSIDSAASDPIPHIIDGIPIHLRDVRVYIDRPNFILNPTSCDVFSLDSVLTGSGQSFGNPADDSTAGAANPFQVSNCSALGFKPKLQLKLKGGTRRGKYPSLKAIATPRPGDTNIGTAQVTLPPSLFLAQEHLDTICTRVQFNANRCPVGSVYGHARAFTPLLGQPLEGPVYLRASDNPLPDLVAALRGQVEIDVLGRIDSYKGGMRSTFDVVPDAPVSKFELTLKGGKKGILANSENLCRGTYRALARFSGQSNHPYVSKPRLEAKCKKARNDKGKRRGKGK